MQTIDPQRLQEAEELLGIVSAMGRRHPIRNPLMASVEELGLTPSQLHTVRWIGTDGPLTMGEIARRLGITDKTITGVVDRLERAGLARRVRDEQDRRVVRVALTEGGEKTFRTIRDCALRNTAGLLSLLSAEERAGLLRVIERIAQAFASGETPFEKAE